MSKYLVTEAGKNLILRDRYLGNHTNTHAHKNKADMIASCLKLVTSMTSSLLWGEISLIGLGLKLGPTDGEANHILKKNR